MQRSIKRPMAHLRPMAHAMTDSMGHATPRWLVAALACSLAAGCALDGAGEPSEAAESRHADPAPLSVSWRPVDHSEGGVWFRSELTIENRGPRTLGAAGWHLYFNFVRRILKDGEGDAAATQDLAGQGVRIAKADAAASGDFFVLEPLATFSPIAPGEHRTVSLLAEAWAILKTDAPAAFHVAFDADHGAPPRAVPATIAIDAADPRQTTRFSGDVMPVDTAALRHADNPAHQALGLADRLLPTPRVVQPGAGQLTLRDRIAIDRPGALAGEARYLAAMLDDAIGADGRRDAASHRPATAIELRLAPGLDIDGDGRPDPEAYALDIAGGRIAIRGTDPAGVFHAIQTLRQLIPLDAQLGAQLAAGKSGHRTIALPEVHIADAPGFAYRGMHLDVARHFQSVATVEKLLDVMAAYKLNKFHIHLTDDEGWRLEIPGIPELTTFGARRGHDLDESAMLHIGLGDGNGLAAGDGIAGKPRTPTEANGGAAPAYQGFETATVNFVGAGSGFYTAREFEHLLAYAAERHIDVIPEIDLPGHARAAVQAMEFRFRRFAKSNPARAAEFRLLDPADSSAHTSVQGYTDNFVNPCLDTTYAFLAKIAHEVAARYRAAGAPLVAIHGGGDELPSLTANVWWQGSPICQTSPATHGMTDPQLFDRFFTQWNQIITATGAEMTGWDDIIHGGLALPGFIPMPWSNVWGWGREDDAYRYANQGYRVVLAHATNLYMDLAYAKDPDEPGYYWANFVDEKKTFEYLPFDIFGNGTADRMGNPIDPSTWNDKVRLTAAGKANVIGMQGLLWGENLKTPQLLEYFAFPKLLGVAERAWNPEPAEPQNTPAAWARFANRLGQDALPRLGAFRAVDLHGELPRAVGVNYRIPMPGAVVAGGMLDANVRFPGLAIEYSTNGGKTWITYAAPVAVSGQIALRTRAPDGRTSRITWVQ
ncbi:MAG TPA: family 20 glycosylhydrolase [Kofleriaceae bacterium]|nr:family 20 glycosylhydrolase [Kofleriaceae bacterium]